MAGTADDCRPWAAAVPGTAVLLELRGHGRSGPAPAEGWDYGTYAEDLLGVADATQATAAVAVSVSSGALLKVLAENPGRFTAAVLALPAAVDSPRTDASVLRLASLGGHGRAGGRRRDHRGDAGRAARRGRRFALARIWARRRAMRLVDSPPPYPRKDLAPPLPTAAALRAVRTPTLVLGELDDPLHLSALAQQAAGEIPGAVLELHPHGALFWTQRDAIAKRVAEHLGAHASPLPGSPPAM